MLLLRPRPHLNAIAPGRLADPTPLNDFRRFRRSREETSMRTLDRKLAAIRAGRYQPADFIIADAKDGDIGFGAAAPGPDPDAPGRFKPRAAHLEAIRQMTRSGLVDVMLLSASSTERLSEEGLFRKSGVTPTIRLNDTTDIWSARGGRYREEPSRHHRTARIDQARKFVDLGLYSVTFSNQRDIDAENAEAYSAFRAEAGKHGMRHFLEVFNPAFDIRLGEGADLGSFINDNIVRTLAGVMHEDQPHFLKLQYNGPRAMEELAGYDPGRLIVGILGGAKGTTRDTFELIAQAERHGARVALFGRKINLAEDPIALVRFMRAVVEKEVGPEEAVKAYHDWLKQAGKKPTLPLAKDRQITEAALKG
jgi:DhnA family fructose-bisphosphate aldolase class Ia